MLNHEIIAFYSDGQENNRAESYTLDNSGIIVHNYSDVVSYKTSGPALFDSPSDGDPLLPAGVLSNTATTSVVMSVSPANMRVKFFWVCKTFFDLLIYFLEILSFSFFALRELPIQPSTQRQFPVVITYHSIQKNIEL